MEVRLHASACATASFDVQLAAFEEGGVHCESDLSMDAVCRLTLLFVSLTWSGRDILQDPTMGVMTILCRKALMTGLSIFVHNRQHDTGAVGFSDAIQERLQQITDLKSPAVRSNCELLYAESGEIRSIAARPKCIAAR